MLIYLLGLGSNGCRECNYLHPAHKIPDRRPSSLSPRYSGIQYPERPGLLARRAKTMARLAILARFPDQDHDEEG